LFFSAGRPSQADSKRGIVLFLVGTYFFLMFLAALRAEPMVQGIYEFRRIMVPQLLSFVLACRGFRGIADFRRFLLALTVLALIVGLFCFWDVFFDINLLHSDMLQKPEYTHNRQIRRFGSIFLNPNLLGGFVVLLFSPMLALFLERQNVRIKALLGATLLALLFCLVQTQSRAPMGTFVGMIALFLVTPVSGLSRTRRFVVVFATVAVFAIVMPGFLRHSTTRFDTIDEEESLSEVSRASIWKYTEAIISDNPILGIGFGETQFLDAMGRTDFERRFGRESLDNPHNSYLQAAVYAGLPALVAFLFANSVLLFKSWKSARHAAAGPGAAKEMFGLSVGITAFLVCSYPDMHLFTFNVAPIYWLFFGLLLWFSTRTGGSDPGENHAFDDAEKRNGRSRRLQATHAPRRSAAKARQADSRQNDDR
jgi:O-antigen ligase